MMNNYSSPTTSADTKPLLYTDLRKALNCLYSLNVTSTTISHPRQQHEAHEFLMLIQSKNVKRKLQSLYQSQQDQLRKNGTLTTTVQPDRQDYGSSWLASLAILCQIDSHPAEKLFCAQTLLHRVRKYKLSEAIDIEIEHCQQYSNVGEMMDQYNSWMNHFHNSFLSSLIQQYSLQHQQQLSESSKEEEERVRGEMSMLVLTAIAYSAATSYKTQQQHQRQIGPLLATLGSAISAIALRIRFTPAYVHKKQQQQHSTQSSDITQTPLVSMIVQSLTIVVAHAASIPNMYDQEGSYLCKCSCLGTIPDTILGSPGGARGRMSIDPKCLHAASDELRHPATGVNLLLKALVSAPPLTPQTIHLQNNTTSLIQSSADIHPYILETCEKWAKFLPLPFEFIEETVPLAAQYINLAKTDIQAVPSMITDAKTAAFGYLIAIFEGASWSVEHVLSFSLGLSSEQRQTQQQSGKKRQSSKSKKRHQEKLQETSNDTRRANAEMECYHRGQVACRATEIAWESLQRAAQTTLMKAASTGDETVDDPLSIMDGEGPIGCVCASANACLPHIVKHATNTDNGSNNQYMMFSAMAPLFQTICSSPHRVIRALTYEPLFSLHSAMIQKEAFNGGSNCGEIPHQLQHLLVDHLYASAMKLATLCGYPPDYFVHLHLDSDEELEVERNDIRDILRTLAGSEGATSSKKNNGEALKLPSLSSMQILKQIIEACSGAIHEETAVHAFSSVAKPLNYIGKVYGSGGSITLDHGLYQILCHTCKVLGDIHEVLLSSIPSKPISETFALGRIAQLATASLSPMLSDICLRVTTSEPNNTSSGIQILRDEFQRAVELSIHSAAISLIHLPELAAESTLGWRRYDIRGAMRGPGGEDHVGCLALMRLAEESDHLTAFIVNPIHGTTSAGSLGPPILLEIGNLHDDLKKIENERGPGINHGKGVAPKSRRILLSVISQFAIVSSAVQGTKQDDWGKVQAMLKGKFFSPVSAIASSRKSTAAGGDAETMFRLCEATFDLASFSPELVSSLFAQLEEGAEANMSRMECMQTLVEGGLSGYTCLSTEINASEDQYLIQWGRLRGALLTLIRSSAHPGLPPLAVEAVVAWINAENHAITMQCQAGPEASSSLFNEAVIGEDMLSAGAMIRVIGEILADLPKRSKRLGFDQIQLLESSRNSISVLQQSMSTVLQTILIDSPMASGDCYVDPRPTVCEAWFLTLFELIEFIEHESGHPQMLCNDPALRYLVSESAAAGLMLLLFPTVKNNVKGIVDIGMSLDGPHMLALMDFLESSFALGPIMLQTIASHLEKTFGISGIPIIGAALFRGGSGGLPPWAVECIPNVFSALFGAFGKDPNNFGKMLVDSMEITLHVNAARFGGVLPGSLFAGPLFKKLSEKTKQEFVQKSLELCAKDTGDAWRRFKVILKQLCGGKKKDSGFNLKPSYTNWECDRI